MTADAHMRVVHKTLTEIAILTAIGPVLYFAGVMSVMQTLGVILTIQCFNMALNIVAYEYALRGYWAAKDLRTVFESLKLQQGTPVRKGQLRSWLDRVRGRGRA